MLGDELFDVFGDEGQLEDFLAIAAFINGFVTESHGQSLSVQGVVVFGVRDADDEIGDADVKLVAECFPGWNVFANEARLLESVGHDAPE
jgi:hypothetical protein